MALLACIVVFILFSLVPIAIAFFRLPGNTIVVGSDSLAISAAYHVSVLSKAVQHDSNGSSIWESIIESTELVDRLPRSSFEVGQAISKVDHRYQSHTINRSDQIADTEPGIDQNAEAFSLITQDRYIYTTVLPEDEQRLSISRSLIRWGEVKMPAEWYAQYDGLPEPVGHLSFDIKAGDVEEPKDGRWYA
jgi:hypothetical protein